MILTAFIFNGDRLAFIKEKRKNSNSILIKGRVSSVPCRDQKKLRESWKADNIPHMI
jgi:hypothetical protein